MIMKDAKHQAPNSKRISNNKFQNPLRFGIWNSFGAWNLEFGASRSSRPGAMLLMTVLIAGAVALTIGLSIALRGIGELDMGFSENQTLETLAIADGCAQEALLRLSRDSDYLGATGLTVGEGACNITVSGSGDERTVSVDATLDRWSRNVTMELDLSTSPITIVGWSQE